MVNLKLHSDKCLKYNIIQQNWNQRPTLKTTLDDKVFIIHGVKYTLLIFFLSHLQFTSTDIPYVTARRRS